MVWHGWESCGVRGQHALPPIAGSMKGLPLLVCGGGRNLHEDAARMPLERWGHTLAVNLACLCVRREFQHLASLHDTLIPHYMGLIRHKTEAHIHTHSYRDAPGVDFAWDLEGQPPCSGLFGAAIGLAMGYQPVVLAGVPEDDNGHFYDPPGDRGDYGTDQNSRAWLWFKDHVFAGRVKSLSGRTRDWLGAPEDR